MESVESIAAKIAHEDLVYLDYSPPVYQQVDRMALERAIASALRAERDNATRAVTDRFLRLVTEVCPNPNCAGEFSSDDGLRRWLRASMSYFGREAPEGCHAPKGHVLDDSGTVRKEADITSERSLTETANAAAVNAYAKVRELEALLDGAKAAVAAERAKLETFAGPDGQPKSVKWPAVAGVSDRDELWEKYIVRDDEDAHAVLSLIAFIDYRLQAAAEAAKEKNDA